MNNLKNLKLVSAVGYITSSICLLCALHISFPTREALTTALILFGSANLLFGILTLKN